MACATVPVVDTYIVGTDAPGTGGWYTITFDFSIDPADIDVLTKEADEDSFTARVQDVEWELDSAGSRLRFIETSPGYDPPDGTIVHIERCTSRTRVVEWVPGNTLTADQINLDNDQQFFILQELEATLSRAMLKDLTGSYWEGQGLEVRTADDATAGDSLVTLRQVQALIAGAEIAHLSDVDVYTFTGTGMETDFELLTIEDISPDQIIVSINGLLQQVGEPGSPQDGLYYTVIGVDETDYPTSFTSAALRFTQPPAYNDIIEVRVFRGTVFTLIGESVIDSASLVDDILEERHFGGIAHSPLARMTFDSTGGIIWEEESSIANFTTALNTWLATKALSDIQGAGTFGNAELKMGANKITGLAAGSANTDAVTFGQFNALAKLAKATRITNITPGERISGVRALGYKPDIVIMSLTHTIGAGGSGPSTYTDTFICMPMSQSGTWYPKGGAAHRVGVAEPFHTLGGSYEVAVTGGGGGGDISWAHVTDSSDINTYTDLTILCLKFG